MLQFVARKPINRCKADEALSQLSSKAFHLLYGKRALDVCQQPQSLCFVPSVQEIWVLYKGGKGKLCTSSSRKYKEQLTTLCCLFALNHGLCWFETCRIQCCTDITCESGKERNVASLK